MQRVLGVRDALIPRSLLENLSPVVVAVGLLCLGLLGGAGYAAKTFLFSGSDADAPRRGEIIAVQYAADNELAVLTKGGWLELWNVDSGERTQVSYEFNLNKLAAGEGRVIAATRDSVIDFARDDFKKTKVLASELKQPIVALRPLESNKAVMLFKSQVQVSDNGQIKEFSLGPMLPRCFVFSPDRELMVHACANGEAVIYDVATVKLLTRSRFGQGKARFIPNCIDFSPDGNFIAVGSAQGQISVRSVSEFDSPRIWEVAQKQRIRALQFTPDSAAIIVADDAPSVTLWPLETMEPRRLDGFDGEQADSLSVSSDGKFVAVGGGEDAEVWILNIADGSLAKKLEPTP